MVIEWISNKEGKTFFCFLCAVVVMFDIIFVDKLRNTNAAVSYTSCFRLMRSYIIKNFIFVLVWCSTSTALEVGNKLLEKKYIDYELILCDNVTLCHVQICAKE